MHEEIATNQNEVELFFVEDSFSKFSVTNMAAPMSCALCRTGIKDKKSYRRVESLVSLKIQLQYLNLISPTSILCCFCFNKINRLHKIDGDLKTKVSKLREEKSVLIGELKALPGFSESENVTTTPKSKPQKRGINTPTPRSCRQVKRQMTKTPLKSRKVLDYENSVPNSCHHKSTQTKIPDNDFEVKVQLLYFNLYFNFIKQALALSCIVQAKIIINEN